MSRKTIYDPVSGTFVNSNFWSGTNLDDLLWYEYLSGDDFIDGRKG